MKVDESRKHSSWDRVKRDRYEYTKYVFWKVNLTGIVIAMELGDRRQEQGFLGKRWSLRALLTSYLTHRTKGK